MQQRDVARFVIKANQADLIGIATQGGTFAVTAY